MKEKNNPYKLINIEELAAELGLSVASTRQAISLHRKYRFMIDEYITRKLNKEITKLKEINDQFTTVSNSG